MEVSNGFQALINILYHDVDLVLPDALIGYVDDPGIHPLDGQQETFAEVHDLLPQLIAHYRDEAEARDSLRAARRLHLAPGTPLHERVRVLVHGLYYEDDPQRYEQLIREWQTLTLQARLKACYLQDRSPETVAFFDQAVASLVLAQRPGQSLLTLRPEGPQIFHSLHALLAKHGVAVPDTDKRLWRMCHSFIVTQSLHDADKIRERLAHNILDLVNRDFTREIIALDDLPTTVLSGKERVFRVLKRTGRSHDTLQHHFNATHRIQSEKTTKNKSLLTYKINTEWNVRNDIGWREGTAVFASLDSYRAMSWMEDNGILLEFMPQPGWVHFGDPHKSLPDYEVLIDQVRPEDVVAIYKGEFYGGLTLNEVHENPNFRGFDKHLAGASYGVGGHGSTEYIPEPYIRAKKQIGVHSSRYPNQEAFLRSNGKKDVRRRRAQLIAQRGYTSYQDKLARFPRTFASLYEGVRQQVHGGQSVDAQRTAELMERVDKIGNSALGRAILDNDRAMLDFCLRQGLSAQAVNFNGQNLLHLAASHNVDVFEELVEKGVSLEAMDIEGFTPLAEALQRGHLRAAERLIRHGARLDRVADDVIRHRTQEFAPHYTAQILYPGVDWVNLAIANKARRIRFITSPPCVEAYEQGHLSLRELLDTDMGWLQGFLELLKACRDTHSVPVPHKPWHKGTRHHEEKRTSVMASVQPALRLVDFSLANRLHVLTASMDLYGTENFLRPEASPIGGVSRSQFLEQARLLKNVDEPVFALLLSEDMLKLHRFGLLPSDFRAYSLKRVQRLLSDAAIEAYARGFKASDFDQVPDNKLAAALERRPPAKQ